MRYILFSFSLLFIHFISANTKFLWLHGLEGEKNANTWDIYSALFAKNNSYIFEYASNNSIKGIAAKIYNEQLKPVAGSDHFVFVGHSMGGLVARSLQQICPNVDGIITAGTAHNGSTAIKNILNGKTYDYLASTIITANSAINESFQNGILSAPPVSFFALPMILPISFFKDMVVKSTLANLREVYLTGVNMYALSHTCITDMLPNSTFLNELNSAKTNIPLINIYGTESNWQVVRALGSLSKVDEVKKYSNIDKSYDTEYVDKIRNGLAFINQIQVTHNFVYTVLAGPAVFLPWIWTTRELILKARYKWDALYWYLENGLHADLATNIGATQFKYQNYCVPSGYSLSELKCISKYMPYVIENDGILPANNVILNSSVSTIPVMNVRIEGVNHQEMGNHIMMRKTLEDIIKYGKYGKAFEN